MKINAKITGFKSFELLSLHKPTTKYNEQTSQTVEHF